MYKFESLDIVSSTIVNVIAMKAWQAMVEEVKTTIKPGLVDRFSNGAHTDMDLELFEKSADALKPYFRQMAIQGLCDAYTYEDLFRRIRSIGIDAEKAMYRATNNVNTHKGLIFSLGIYCAAAARCLTEYGKINEYTLQIVQKMMTTRILTEEIAAMKTREAVTNGEKNLRNYGTAGIRGEALAGYPSVWNYAFPTMRQGIAEGHDYNRVKIQTLFVLMSKVDDSNIVARTNPEVLRRVQKEASEFLQAGGAYRDDVWGVLVEMDQNYTANRISAGGCADLLAVTIFLQKLLDERDVIKW